MSSNVDTFDCDRCNQEKPVDGATKERDPKGWPEYVCRDCQDGAIDAAEMLGWR